ncbi:thiol reductant ABC exporter subunit CydC [Agromyces intestinalis]|uniref:Thiol reductant ABC exporter subunit CydC n=1 Tax=Agromyces intestinalis TaxID=2592652 RepID=A0A5C1YAQ6_9MICO|nr:thiol reductant ABC exporter subunit CydC [Agromyces intestinalis]QEO13164.1 thiol reductant ABC exporter subunit CydC [Agromyces intestinalis]
MSEPTTRAVLRQAVPPVRRLLPAILLGVLSAASSVALLACSAWLIVRAAEQPPILYLSVAVVGVRAFALGRASFRYLERIAGHDASFRQLAAIRSGVYERLLPFAPDGLAATRRGDLLARFVGDVDDLQMVALRVVQPLVSAGVVLVLAIAGVWLIAPASGAALAGCLVVGVAAALALQRVAARRAERELAPLRGRLQAAIVDHLQAIDVLVAFDAADSSARRIDEFGERLARTARRRSLAAGGAAAVMAAIAGIAAAASAAAGAPVLADGRITGPAFAVLALVPLAIAEVAAAVPVAVAAARQAGASARRVAEAVPAVVPPELSAMIAASEAPAGATPDEMDPAAPGTGGVRPPTIRLRGVGAAWPAVNGIAAGAALSHVDLDLAPGERVLLRGASGAGKTTLAHVLVRFLAGTGSYRIDGVEAAELDPARVRRRIGLVEQRPWIFDEDLRQNLLFARDTASDDELLAVLGQVGLADWARERGGLDAPVGERGALVSGGQAQRIALARALLAEFPVLVLDEPTANVDAAQAAAVLDELMRAAARDGRSVLLISHVDVDPSIIDRVVEIDAGRTAPAAPGSRAARPVR